MANDAQRGTSSRGTVFAGGAVGLPGFGFGGGGFGALGGGAVSTAGTAVAPAQPTQAPPPLSADWRLWVAENLLLGRTPDTILEAMRQAGLDDRTAVAEINSAANHPYLAAARKVGTFGDAAGATLENKVKKREWVLECYRRNARQSTTFGEVPRVRTPSRQEFLDNYYALNRPVVIQGAMDNWPAMHEWTAEKLKQRFGERIVEVQANRTSDKNYELNSVKHKKDMRFGDYIDVIEQSGETNDWYMTANNSGKNRETLKELWDDIILFPEYLRTDDPNGSGFFWMGPAGTVTPLHHDLTNNFMAQVRGRKLCRLIAPHDLADMYNNRHCFSQVDLDNVDYEKYPRFRDVRVIDVTIGPGDLLFLPVGWWHYVRGLDVTITMTFTNFIFDNDFYSFYSTYQEI